MAIINQLVAISTDDLVDTLADEMTREELFEFIKRIDLAVADWDFTNDLISYFKEQEKVYVNEVMEHGI
jgi:regulator of sirC expression with transglutaminase-like and TPR domain